MYLSKHQGGNAVSTSEQNDTDETKKWKRDVLEAYLGVTLKRQFTTGPEAFAEILQRLEQFTRSLAEQEDLAATDQLPTAVVDTVTSLALAVDAKDPYTQGHSQKVSQYALKLAQALGLGPAEEEEMRLAGLLHDVGKVGIPESILNKAGPLDASEWEIDEEPHQARLRNCWSPCARSDAFSKWCSTITNSMMAPDIHTL